MNKLNTLAQLIDGLVRLETLLALDTECQWTSKFAADLKRARQLVVGPINSVNLAELSASVRHAYAGMGSFNDYAPAVYDSATGRYKIIPGTEDFDRIQEEVFDLALALVVTEH